MNLSTFAISSPDAQLNSASDTLPQAAKAALVVASVGAENAALATAMLNSSFFMFSLSLPFGLDHPVFGLQAAYSHHLSVAFVATGIFHAVERAVYPARLHESKHKASIPFINDLTEIYRLFAYILLFRADAIRRRARTSISCFA
jgi:hypothetical protein